MLLELGPLAAEDVEQWARFARRVMCEVRVDPCDLEGVATTDFLDQWHCLIDAWEGHAKREGTTFRWSSHIDVELARYLLHGLDRCVHSTVVQQLATPDERTAYATFTFQVMQAFIDGLSGQGDSHEHFIDQIRGSVGERLDH